MGFFFAGVSRIGPGEAAVFSTIEPVVSIAVGVYALDENLTTARVIGALCVLVSVAVLAQLSRADTK
jgi:drug/metabolite transporter (DMT)-like permease